MKKKTIIIAAAIVLVVAAGLFLYRHRGGDITGVTTYAAWNTIIMNGKAGQDLFAGSGFLTVGEGEHIHMEYALSAGSFDIYFNADENAASAYENMDVENLPTAGDMTSDTAFGQDGVEGKGSLDFEADAGQYTAHFVFHDTIGKATVTAQKDKS